jgi:hypothetical protein
VAEPYGAWRERTNYGKTYMGIQRSTFLIDAEGVVRKVWKKVDVQQHDQQVLDALDGLVDVVAPFASGCRGSAAAKAPRPAPGAARAGPRSSVRAGGCGMASFARKR